MANGMDDSGLLKWLLAAVGGLILGALGWLWNMTTGARSSAGRAELKVNRLERFQQFLE